MRFVAYLLLACVLPLPAAVVVVDQSHAALSIDADQVRNMLVGRISSWPDGSPVHLVLVDGQQAIETLTGRDLSRLMRGWKRLVFSGSAAMPHLAGSIPEAMRLAGSLRGALLVLDDEPEGATDTVRIIRLPTDG